MPLFRLCTQGAFKMWKKFLETSGVWSQELTSPGKKKYWSCTGISSLRDPVPVGQPVGRSQIMVHSPRFYKARRIWTAEIPWLHGSQLLLPSSEQELNAGPHVLETDRTELAGQEEALLTWLFCREMWGERRSWDSWDLWSISSRGFSLSSSSVRALTQMCL